MLSSLLLRGQLSFNQNENTNNQKMQMLLYAWTSVQHMVALRRFLRPPSTRPHIHTILGITRHSTQHKAPLHSSPQGEQYTAHSTQHLHRVLSKAHSTQHTALAHWHIAHSTQHNAHSIMHTRPHLHTPQLPLQATNQLSSQEKKGKIRIG